MSSYRPDPALLTLGSEFYDAVEPARFPDCTPRFLNERWAERVGLHLDETCARHFCRFEPLPDNLTEPLALRYHGHQFRIYNPDIGDGRGFIFAQLRDDRGRLLDLGTKGSGQTPYSRHADGRLTLKGGVREVLATEMLEALGVNTSKSFACSRPEKSWSAATSPPRPAPRSLLASAIAISASARSSASPSSVRPRTSRSSSATASKFSIRETAGRQMMPSMRCACSTWSARQPRSSPPHISRQALSMACSTATISTSPARASITARGDLLRVGSGIHCGLFRPLRPLLVRPAAGGDPLGPRAIGGLPVAHC